MITLQHSLITLFSTKDKEEGQFDKEVSSVIAPDAYRRYLGPRQYSHFERSEDKKDVSWMEYPKDMKHFNKEVAEKLKKHMTANVRPCCLGEETDVRAFEEHNCHLDNDYYAGVKKHLTQDAIFDRKIREWIDCSEKYDHKFKFDGQELDDAGVRTLIADIENHGVYVLAYMLNKTKGITTDQKWFDENVKTALDRDYSEDLSEGTYKYMKIPERVNEWITNNDWSHLNEGPIPLDEYKKLYSEVSKEMTNIDFEKETRVPAKAKEERTID